MPSEDKLLQLPLLLLYNLDLAYTFILLLTRFTGLFLFLPGLGSGLGGVATRIPAIFIIAASLTLAVPKAKIPNDEFILIAQLTGEFFLGTIVGLFPTIIISTIQNAGQISATTMGLGAGALFDPTTQSQSTTLAKLLSDLGVIVYLLGNGYHTALFALSSTKMAVPGAFFINLSTVSGLIEQTEMIFSSGFILASPVLIAILLTNFALGLISRAVTQINIFIISFPLTIAIGLVLTILSFSKMYSEISVIIRQSDITLFRLLN
jgi:flagellar biosynthesis protein FliR